MSSLSKALITSVLILTIVNVSASAQQAQTTPEGHAYMVAMERMQEQMKKGMDSDPTKAWAKMMIPHHQGAIEMSQAVLKSTKDPEIRKMAQKGIDEQTKEIKQLQAWIAKHGG